ncbi:gamma-glutamylcyclotransferase family protein [Candidatus Riflebacteria bacterium]
MEKTNPVFVYGTLRKGFGNHKYYLKGSPFIGTGKTVEKYAMYATSIPYVVQGEGLSRISGEVYRVDSETLDNLDSLEGHPDFYCREITEIEMDDGSIIRAWLYFYPETKGWLIESGDFKDNFSEFHNEREGADGSKTR